MNENEQSEKSRLLELFLLMKVPSVLAFVSVMFMVPTNETVVSNMWWIIGPMGVISLFVLALPFFWKGELSYKEVIRRVFRRPGGLSIALAVLPIILWVSALFLLVKSPERPYSLHLPSFLFKQGQFRSQILVSGLLGGLSGTVGVLVFANATQYSTRVKFMCLFFGFDIIFRFVQYSWSYYKFQGISHEIAAKFISPVFDIILSIGFFAVIVGLMQRGRSSVQAIAVFLTTYLVFRYTASNESSREAAIGLFGGSAVIHLVNYLQKSGLWVRWSPEVYGEPLAPIGPADING
jgi:hypothetical protein